MRAVITDYIRRRGNDGKMTIINDSLIVKVKDLMSSGMSYKGVAKSVGVSATTVTKICKSIDVKSNHTFPRTQIASPNEVYVCSNCGKEYPRKKERHGKDGTKFCSRECFFELIHKNKQPKEIRPKVEYVIVCRVCGQSFLSCCKNTLLCSRECKKAEARINARKNAEGKYNELNIVKVCNLCGKEFVPKYGEKGKTFCSEFCVARNAKLNQKRHKKKRRAIIKGALAIEYFNEAEIFERDLWFCQICGKRVNKRLEYPNAKCASLDHIVPLSLGGTHTKNNVQLAHLDCNIKRGNKGKKHIQTKMFGV